MLLNNINRRVSQIEPNRSLKDHIFFSNERMSSLRIIKKIKMLDILSTFREPMQFLCSFNSSRKSRH